jgi:shikimate dehydrogenase
MKQLGLIGFPLGHSRSPELFQQFFSRDGAQGWEYHLFPMEQVGGLREWIRHQPELRGLNVTIPHKEAVIPQLDELDDTARQTGAVNCIRITREPILRLVGYNTDTAGFAAMLDAARVPDGTRALVLGNGGAAQAVCFVLRSRGIPFAQLGRKSAGDILAYAAADASLIRGHRLIINTTPLGMQGMYEGQAPELPYAAIGAEHYCLDLVYKPEQTAFMQHCAAQGAYTANGSLMLEVQAEAAWKIFRG